MGDAGSIRINGTEYKLQQGHWHAPSEHSINGRRSASPSFLYFHSSVSRTQLVQRPHLLCFFNVRYDLELHMVHVSPDNNIAVVGLLYKTGQPDKFLSKVKLPSTAAEKHYCQSVLIDYSLI